MSYMALYRKFRPQTFGQVKGQDHVVRTLKNQISNNRIGHAYLFSGTRGTGKTSVAKLFAKAVNCLNSVDGEPCGECENCRAIARDAFMDVVEVDAASNTGVDDIRRIIEEVRYSPAKGKYKVYIIDEAHMLSGAAFNAFLKTLEEPPAYAVFILATTEAHKLPITILSRCQRYDFHRIGTETIAANLSSLLASEGVEAEDRAVSYIARMGDGSMRDAISLLDKCIAFSLGGKMTYDMVLQTLGTVDTEVFSRTFHAIWRGDAAAALKEIELAADSGGDISRFVNDFIWYLRNLLLIKAAPSTDAEVLGISVENMEILRADAAGADEEILMRYIRIMSSLANDIRSVSSRQIPVEVAFIKLARPEMESDNASLADRIRHLEDMISRGSFAAAGKADTGGQQHAENAETQHNRQMPEVQPVREMQPEPQQMYEIPNIEEIPGILQPESVYAGTQMQAFGVPQETEYMQSAGAVLDNTFTQTPDAPQDQCCAPAAAAYSSPAQQACAAWEGIVTNIDSPRVRFAIKKAQVRAAGQDILQIYGIDGINYSSLRENSTDIEKTIEAYTGHKITVEVLQGAAPERSSAPAQQAETKQTMGEDLDNLLKFINFDVKMED